MEIEQMHYDVKMKLNKIDSQQYRNLIIPQIDWLLNEAQEIFVEIVAFPRKAIQYGFEVGTMTIMDIRSVVVENLPLIPDTDKNVILPEDFWIYISSYSNIRKGTCTKDSFKTYIRQHDDDFENSPFDCSSFEWRTINAVFNQNGIKLYAKDFIIERFFLTYIKKLKYIHNAKDFQGGSYKLPGIDLPLTGSVNCELPEHTHRKIVDIAVLLATGQLQIPDYQIKKDKLSLNQII
jgi:hypothetical protein